MRIEQFSDEHGIYVRASEEAFMMTRDEARNHLLYIRELQAENAKLRELVRDMHIALFSLNFDHCQACPREDACVFIDCGECALERDMQELGMGVDA